MEKPLNILMLADGRAFHTERYISAVREQGHNIKLASLEPGEMVDIPLRGRIGVTGLDYLFIARQIPDLVRKHGFNLVNAHSASGYGFSVTVSRIWNSIPYVLHCLGSDILISARKSALHEARVRTALGRANAVFVDSEYVSSKVKEIESLSKTMIEYWGAEKDIFDTFDQRNKIARLDTPLRILIPRPHEDVYNNEFIIKALGDYLSDNKAKLTFPNWGSRLESFKAMIRESFDENQIKFYDRIIRKDYAPFLLNYDIYLSASNSDSSPASLIEAMASGLFPVVGNIPGIREWMNERSGLIFDIDKPESLKSAFNRLINDPPDLEKIILNNHERAMLKGQFEKGIESTLQIMQNLCNE